MSTTELDPIRRTRAKIERYGFSGPNHSGLKNLCECQLAIAEQLQALNKNIERIAGVLEGATLNDGAFKAGVEIHQ